MDLREPLADAIAGRPIDEAAMERAIDLIMTGRADPIQAAGLLAALATRGESVEEVVGAARAMRRNAEPFPSRRAADGIDTCGTGGDGAHTFNISTAAAFVVAAAGVPVAKHGNRAVSSKAGSADVLAALGAVIDLEPGPMARVLDRTGIGFLFAPVYHKAMRHAMPIRRALGVRTIFNLLGPVSNPAHVRRQVIGVFHPRWLDLADVLGRLGSTRALVVHGADGLDEISLAAPTHVAELRPDGSITRYTLDPALIGLEPCTLADLRGGDAAENAALLRATFDGPPVSPIARAVQLNAAAALYVADKATSIPNALELAASLIAEGHARRVLDDFVEATREQAAPR